MTDREKQIEELSKEICNGCKTRHKCENKDGFCIMSDVVSEYLLNKGYRKAEIVKKETAEEIFNDIKYGIENTLYYRFNSALAYELKTILLHIKKKYGLQLEDD